MNIRDISRKVLRTFHPATRRPRPRLVVTQLEDRVNPAPIQFFYIPMPEAQVNASLDAVVTNTSISASEESATTITVTEDNTTVWYDQWEDGYEAILGTPRQATTQVWGDGNDANGIAPGFATDPAGLQSGTVLELRNTVDVPRDQTAQPLLFDSPDKFGADKTLAVSRVQFPTLVNGTGGSVISSAVEVRDTRFYDTTFTAPVGTDTPNATRAGENSMFSYSAVYVQAFLDNTHVRIDANHDGDFTDPDDRDVILNQGQTVVSGPGALQGARVVADKPVQTDLLTGEVGGQYASRTYALFSDAQATNDYFTPVGFGNDDPNAGNDNVDGPSGDNANQDDVRLYAFNPNAFTIHVRREDTGGTAAAVDVLPGQTAAFDVTINSGTRLFTVDAAGNPNQDKFLALGVHDAPGGNTAVTHDWGFSLQPRAALSQVAIVGLGIGNSNNPPAGGGNTSPVFVTALVPVGQPNTTLFVDDNNDGTVDHAITVTRLQSVRLRDTTTTDDDNSGMRIFTTDGTLISLAWGEDGTAPAGSPGLDAGTTIPAIPVPEYYKFSTFAPGGDANGDGFFNEGDTIRYSLRIRHIGTTPISNAVITDTLPLGQVTYVAGSATVNGVPLADDGAGTPFPFDGAGYTVVNINPGETITAQFDATINSGLPPGYNFILNQSVLAYDIFRLPANDVIDLRGTIGDRVWYDVNGDGVQDAGEPGIAGATVTVTWYGPDGLPGGTDDQTFTATTGADGLWSLTNLPAGNYAAAVSALPSGLTAQTFGVNTFNLPSGQVNRSDIDFGFRGTGAIGDFVWADTNANGLQDGGEPGLPGATVTLTWAGFDGAFNTADDITYPAATTAAGAANYGFANLPAGNFRAAVTPPTGGTISPRDVGANDAIDNDFDPTTGLTATIALTAGATNATVDAGIRMSADLRVAKDDGVTAVTPGTTVTYTITVTNAGPAAVTGAAVADAIPATLTGVTWTSAVAGAAGVTAGATGSGNALAATVDLPAGLGNSVVFTVTGTVAPAATGSLTNQATVTAPPGIFDTNTANNTGSDTDTLTPSADLVVTKTDGGATAVPGGLVTYTITVTNNGPSASGAITLADPIPANLSYVSASNGGAPAAGSVTWSLASLAPTAGTQVTVTFRVAATVAAGVTQLGNAATAAGTAPDPDGTNNTGSDTTPLTAAPDLRVVKTDGGATAVPGGLVTYTITVFNDGNQGATGVTLTEAVPANTTFVAAGSSGGWNAAGTSLSVGGLAAGASAAFTYQVRVTAPFPVGATQISNTVDVADDNANGPDPTPLNNESVVSTPVAGGRIGDRVFLDANGNGVQDGGEAGVPGVTVQLLDAGTLAVLDTKTTDPGGNYSFTNLPGGNYRVAFGNTDGTSTFAFAAAGRGGDPTADSDPDAAGLTPTVALAAAQLRDDIDAGVFVPVTIGDTVFYDADGNGVQAGEPGVPNVTVALYYAGPDGAFDPADLAAPFRTAVTGPTGTYSFAGLAPGNYRVAVDPTQAALANTGLTAPTTATTQPTTLTSGGTDLARDFGFTGAGSLGDRVWLDRNADGVQDAAEPGLPGLPVTVTWLGFDGASGGGDDVTYPAVPTGVNGAYLLINLPLGSFVVSVNPAGTNLTPTYDPDAGTAGANGSATLVLTSGAPSTNAADFGFRGTASVGDLVFQDTDRDGFFDAGTEFGLPGVAVTVRWAGGDGLLDTPDDAVFTVPTDANGLYTFAGLPVYGASDPYRVTIIPLAGYAATGDLDGVATPNAAVLALGPTDVRTDADFALGGAPGQSLAGSVYQDLNANGVRDAGEPGIAGATVRLSGVDGFGRAIVNPATGQPFFDAVTLGDGSFVFDNLIPGTYALAEPVQPPAYNDGLDAAGTLNGAVGNDVVSGIALAAGAAGTGYTFGEVGTTVGGTVFVDLDRDGARGPADPPLANVVVELLDAGGAVVATAVSGPDGAYLFANVFPGTYTVREAQPAGYGDPAAGPAAPNTRPVTVAAAPVGGLDFGDTLSSLSGTVYLDANRGGGRDAGEPGLGGVVVTLTGTDAAGAAVTRTTTTAADGSYLFAGVRGGTYTLTETQPTSLADGADAAGSVNGVSLGVVGNDVVSAVTLAAGADYLGQLFGEQPPPAPTLGTTFVAGTVFLDANGNGVLDGGEAGIPNVTIELRGAGGVVLQTATTRPDGTYLFLNVAPGAYTVAEPTQPAGLGSTSPDVLAVTVAAGPVPVANVNFGEAPTSVSGRAYLDLNGSGTPDAGEPGLAGVAVTLAGTDAGGQPVTRAATTAADGTFRFTDLPPGTYTVTETQPTGLADGADLAGSNGVAGNDVVSGITLAAGAAATGIAFGELPAAGPGLSFISGTVFIDADRDGTRGPNEAPVPVVTVELLGPDGTTVVATTQTGPDGRYTFPGLPPGTYFVRETQPAGLASTTPNLLPVSVTPASPAANVAFGEVAGSVAGSVFQDFNGNGARDPGEPGIGGAAVTLTGPAGFTQTVTTAPDGTYRFDGVPDGAYVLTETQPPGYLDGPDAFGTAGGTVGNDVIANIVLTGGPAAVGYTFAEVGPNSVAGTVYNDNNMNGMLDPAAGDTGFGAGVLVLLTGTDAGGNLITRSVRTAAGGTYGFTDLPAGTYRIVEDQPGLPTTATPPDGVYDGADNPGAPGGSVGAKNQLRVALAGDNALPAQAATGFNFGELPPADPFGFAFVDGNANGRFDAGEPALPGVTVTISGTAFAGTPAARPLTAADLPNGMTVTTDATGRYQFNPVPPGLYTIALTTGPAAPLALFRLENADPNAPVPTVGAAAFSNVVQNPLPARGALNFGFVAPVSLAGTVYLDANGNGARDAGEPGVGGVTVRLTGTDGLGTAVSLTAVTAADGSYSFPGLLPGVYDLTETQPANLFQGVNQAGTAAGTPVATDVIRQITLTSGTAATNYLFGERPVAPTTAPALPPLTPPADPPADVSKRMFLSSTPDAVVQPDTGRMTPDFAALGSVSTARNPVFVATAEGAGGDLIRVFDLTAGTERFRFRPFPGNPGGVRVAVADLTGDGVPDVVAAAGPGGSPRVVVYDGNSGAVLFDFLAFEATFTGGLYVAAGDVNRDGLADLVVTPDVGGGPRAKVLAGGDPTRVLADIWAIDDPAFRGGVRPALGDLNGDGVADLAVTAGAGGGPRVAVWDGATLGGGAPTRLVADFFLFEQTLRDGAYLAMGDVDRDGGADLIAGAGPGGAPRVVTFTSADLLAGRRAPASSFMAGDAADRGGVPVAAVDVDGDGRAEVFSGAGSGSLPRVRFTDPRTGQLLDQFAAEYMAFRGGVLVG